MTKKLIGGIVVAAIALTMALNVSLNAKNNGFSDIVLANVEALARGETIYVCDVPPYPPVCGINEDGSKVYGEVIGVIIIY